MKEDRNRGSKEVEGEITIGEMIEDFSHNAVPNYCSKTKTP